MNMPLYTVMTFTADYNCYTTDDVYRVLRKLGEHDIFHRPPKETKVYLFLSWFDVTKDFIKN